MSAEKRMDRLWHAACKQVRAMGRLRRSVRRNARVETVLSLVLSVGIVTTALLPSTAQLRTCETRERSVFTLVEGDYMNPLISSATTIHILNSVANEVAQFAGFDDFSGRVKVNDAVHLVNITRFSGCLLSILNLEFALRDKTHRAGTPIYISESFWKTNFGARTDILGTEVIIHELRYQIAGVIRDFDGLLAKTDFWVPVSSRSRLGTLNSMKILGALSAGADWHVAQEKLADIFERPLIEQAYLEAKGAKLLPIARAIQFSESAAIAATRGSRGKFALFGS